MCMAIAMNFIELSYSTVFAVSAACFQAQYNYFQNEPGGRPKIPRLNLEYSGEIPSRKVIVRSPYGPSSLWFRVVWTPDRLSFTAMAF